MFVILVVVTVRVVASAAVVLAMRPSSLIDAVIATGVFWAWLGGPLLCGFAVAMARRRAPVVIVPALVLVVFAVQPYSGGLGSPCHGWRSVRWRSLGRPQPSGGGKRSSLFRSFWSSSELRC